MAVFEIYRTPDGRYFWTARDEAGRPVGHSAVFPTKEECKQTIEELRSSGATQIVDRTEELPRTKN